tara:strand:- start:727 stop:1524 length:798 start_codon:yes stop_codon:yes gene_type:complete
MAYGKIKADAIIRDNGGSDEEITMATIVTLDSGKAPKASPTFTGTVTVPDVTATGDITLNAQQELRLADSDSSNYIALASAATVGTNSTWTLPADAPVAGDALKVTSVSSNNPTLEWGAISSKIVGCAVFTNNTRNASTASSTSYVELFTFNYNKQQAGTELWMWGSTQAYGAHSGGSNLEFHYGSTIDASAGSLHYPNTYGLLLNWAGRISGHTTTGSQAVSLGYNSDTKPFGVLHPVNTDHGGFASSGNGGTGTTIFLLEVDV